MSKKPFKLVGVKRMNIFRIWPDSGPRWVVMLYNVTPDGLPLNHIVTHECQTFRAALHIAADIARDHPDLVPIADVDLTRKEHATPDDTYSRKLWSEAIGESFEYTWDIGASAVQRRLRTRYAILRAESEINILREQVKLNMTHARSEKHIGDEESTARVQLFVARARRFNRQIIAHQKHKALLLEKLEEMTDAD